MQVVIDTNIWISFLISNLLKGLDDSILSGRVEVKICRQQLDEIIEVLRRPKFKKHFTEDDIAEFIYFLSKTASIINIRDEIKDCRDVKDNFILETAIVGNAELIVTGDKDLLELNPYHGVKIIPPKQFEKILSIKRRVSRSSR